MIYRLWNLTELVVHLSYSLVLLYYTIAKLISSCSEYRTRMFLSVICAKAMKENTLIIR